MALGSKRLDTPELDFLGGCGPHFYGDEEKWPYTYLSSTTLVYSILIICLFSSLIAFIKIISSEEPYGIDLCTIPCSAIQSLFFRFVSAARTFSIRWKSARFLYECYFFLCLDNFVAIVINEQTNARYFSTLFVFLQAGTPK